MSSDAGVFPAALQKGDLVAFVSPSFRMNNVLPNQVQRAIALFNKLGFEVSVAPADPDLSHNYDADLELRRDELHKAFGDPKVKAVFCTVGGAYIHELLPLLDWDLIRANPKILVGFSDITGLHCAVSTQTGLRTFYGPMAIDPLGGRPEHSTFTIESLLKVITPDGQRPIGQAPASSEWSNDIGVFDDDESFEPVMHKSQGWKWMRSGKATGRVFGGCVEPLMNLPGTKFWPDWTDRILLLETSMGEDFGKGASLERVRAQMATLRMLGVFGKVRGLIIGRPYSYTDEERKEFDEIVERQTRGYSFPILIDVNIGHTSPIMTVPLNGMVELDSETDTFEFLEKNVV